MVTRYVPEFEKRWNRFSKAVSTSWRVDETYISIKARWHYLYRAVDKHGKTVDFLLRRDRGALVHLRIFQSWWGLSSLRARFYASAIAHSFLRDQPRRRRPQPNENCRLRIRWASSMPAIVIAAFANDLNPAIDAHRRLIAR
jgi:hypothetical protein